MYSLIPLGTFILSTLYALCRLGVFSICNPLRCCPKVSGSTEQTRLTPKQLFRYKKALLAKNCEENELEPAKFESPEIILESTEEKFEEKEISPTRAKTKLEPHRINWDRNCFDISEEDFAVALEHFENIA